jgi:ABC-2 type transport system permease protein
VDGEESTTAGTAVGYVNAIAQSYSNEIVLKAMARKGRRGELLPVDSRPRVWFNPDLKSARFLVPGLMGFILMIVVVISTSLSVVREKERGSLEQITVSPAKPIDLILGKTIPYAVISLVSSHLVLLLGYLLFDVSIKGSYLWLLLGMVFFLVSGLGMGLLISTIAQTQQAAFSISVLTTMLPTFILSGFVFPIRNMPVAIQVVTYFIPARYFLFILRSIMLKGVGLSAFWSQMVFLVVFAVLTLGVSSARLGKIIKEG